MKIDSYMPVKIISGEFCVINNADIFSRYGKRCFVVTGKNSAKASGALDDVLSVFEDKEILFELFDEIEPNPETLTCKRAGESARNFGADYILGIGGGSVLDAAKAVAIFCSSPELSYSDIYKRKVPSSHIPVLLIGTTAGTGSEVTGVSVLTNSDSGLKKSISGADCYADVAFCDYRYTESVNNLTCRSTCLDALAHAVESYLSNTSNELSEMYALRALGIILPFVIDKGFSDLSREDYENLYIASIFAGLAINITGTCFPHTVGYYLTESYNVPHGIACAVFMPVLLERANKYCPEKIEAIFKNYSVEQLINALNTYTDIDIKISQEEAKCVSSRWESGVKNFDRTPGGFTYLHAEKALIEIFS